MPRRNMIPPLPESFGGSEYERFQRFAKAVLAVSKFEVATPEQTLARLENEKRRIGAKIAEVRRELAKQRTE